MSAMGQTRTFGKLRRGVFAPESRHCSASLACPRCAKSGPMRRSKQRSSFDRLVGAASHRWRRAPKADIASDVVTCPLSAKSRHTQCRKPPLSDHIVGAASTVEGTSRPSAFACCSRANRRFDVRSAVALFLLSPRSLSRGRSVDCMSRQSLSCPRLLLQNRP